MVSTLTCPRQTFGPFSFPLGPCYGPKMLSFVFPGPLASERKVKRNPSVPYSGKHPPTSQGRRNMTLSQNKLCSVHAPDVGSFFCVNIAGVLKWWFSFLSPFKPPPKRVPQAHMAAVSPITLRMGHPCLGRRKMSPHRLHLQAGNKKSGRPRWMFKHLHLFSKSHLPVTTMILDNIYIYT